MRLYTLKETSFFKVFVGTIRFCTNLTVLCGFKSFSATLEVLDNNFFLLSINIMFQVTVEII